MSIVLAPSILSADASRFADEIVAIDKAGADWIHIDVMDGRFVPNLTFGPPVIRALREHSKKTFDVHLMIEDPDSSIEQYAKAGADIITVHAEATTHLHRSLGAIREMGARAGVSLNPSTPISAIEWVLPYCDLVLVMSVNPGFGGQSFIPQSIHKVQKLKTMRDNAKLSFLIEIDGGINAQTIASAKDAGVDVFVAGSAVFASSDYTKNIQNLRDAALGA